MKVTRLADAVGFILVSSSHAACVSLYSALGLNKA